MSIRQGASAKIAGSLAIRVSHTAELRDFSTADLPPPLKEHTEVLAGALRLAKLGTWRWDPNVNTLWFSPEIAEILGRPGIAMVSSEQMQAMYHPQDLAKAFAVFRRAVIEQVPVTLEYRLLHPNGSEIHMLTHAEPVCGPDGRTALVRGTTQDITSLRRIEAALRESEDHYRHMVELHPQIPWTAGPDGVLLEAGPRWYEITGTTPETAIPNGWIDAVHADDRALVTQAWANALQSAGRLDIEFRVCRPSCNHLWMRSRAAPRLGLNGEVIRWYGTLEDITEKKLTQERLRYAAEHDVLTGALNRATLFAELTILLARRSTATCTALLCFDLDYFKDINDNYGHLIGDELLKQMASRIVPLLSAGDHLARSGGDEFMILLANAKTANDVEVFASRISAAIQSPFILGGLSLSRTVSIGAALARPEDVSPTQLYQKADMALYVAKNRSRGSYVMFRPQMQQEFEATRKLRIELSSAITKAQLFLEFQPIMLTDSKQVVGVEALLRWQHPELGRIPPAQFIQLAEETGLIAEIGAWVIREAARAAAGFPNDLKISVNVSPRQFELGDIETLVANILSDSGLAPERLKLEVTESVLMQETSANLKKLQTLREMGVTIMLDDFGAGYSSLSYLENFRFDIIKIDKSFLTKIHTVDDSHPIFEAIIAMASALKIPVTVEGVETQTQLNYVARLGCPYVQGYFLARPMPLPALLSFLQSHT